MTGQTGRRGPVPEPLRYRLDAACQRAVGQLLNDVHGTGLPRLVWRVVTDPSGWTRSAIGQVESLTDDQARTVLHAWADRHHLVPAVDQVPGTGEVHGQIDGLPVQVWAVTDRTTFDQDTATSTATTGGLS